MPSPPESHPRHLASDPAARNLRDGERRTVSILFADMQGFTALTESLDPEETENIMNMIYASFHRIVELQGGIVEKYIGDALVAVFGVPHVHADDPVRAVHASLDFLGEIQRLNRLLRPREVRLTFRSGIHTGLVTTGERGGHRVVSGHAMSIASRLESHAPADGVLVSQETQEKCENDFVFSPGRVIDIHGSSRPVRVYEVLERSSRPYPQHAAFCGRTHLLQEIMQLYVQHRRDTPGGICISGDPGMGKSALLGEFISQLAEFPVQPPTVLYARARRFSPVAFSVCSDLIASLADIRPEHTPEQNQQALLAILPTEREAIQQFIAFHADPLSSDSNTVFAALVRLFHAITQLRTAPYSTVICIDDAGSIDRNSRELLQYLQESDTPQPFLLLAEQTITAELQALSRHCTPIRVPPMSETTANELIDIMDSSLSRELRARIIRACRGNPLFLREYVRFVHEHPDSSELPSTIQNIFLVSIDRFPDEVRDLLKKMTAFVLDFTTADAVYVEEHTGGCSECVADALEQFAALGFLVHEDDSWRFQHDAFKQAVYDSLLHHNRRVLHRVIASLMQTQPSPHTIRLLHHLLRAEDYSGAAAIMQHAPQRFLNLEYAAYLTALLEHITDSSTRIQLLFNHSALLFNNGDSSRAEHSLCEILQAALEEHNTRYLATAYHLLTGYYVRACSFDKAVYTGSKALHYYSGDDNYHRANVLTLTASAEHMQNHPDKARQLLEQLRPLLPDSYPEYRSALSEYELLAGNYAAALAAVQPELARRHPDGDSQHAETLAATLFRAAEAHWHRCDFEQLIEFIPRVLRIPSRNFGGLCRMQAYLAAACAFTGDSGSSGQAREQAELYLFRIPNEFDRIAALRDLATSSLYCGDIAAAATHATRGLAAGLQYAAHYPTFSILMLLADIALRQDSPERARFYLAEADFLIALGSLLQRQDRILYHSFAARLRSQDRERNRAAAASLLQAERAGTGDDRLHQRWLSARSYATIIPETSEATDE